MIICKIIIFNIDYIYIMSYIKKYLYGDIVFLNSEQSSLLFKDSDTYQEYINDYLKKYYKSNSNIIDVGSNVGIFTISFAKIANNCNIHSFEAVTKTRKLLKETVKINNLKNVTMYDFGLGDKDELININIDESNLGNSSIIHNFNSMDKNDSSNGKELIQIKKLDDLNIKNISFIKIDIQEYEYQFLIGAKNTLINNNVVIIIEIPTRNKYEINIHNKCVELLKSYGYKYYKNCRDKKRNKGSKDFIFRKTPL